MTRLLPAALLFCLMAGFPPSASATSDPMSFSVDVPAGQWKEIRLKDLPRDVQVILAVQSNGPLTVGFLDSQDHQRFPLMAQPLFWGQLESKLGFSVMIQQKGDYYVVLDNREGTARRAVNLTARAALSGPAAQALMAEQLRKVEAQLKALEQKLAQTFAFDPIAIHVRPCQRGRSFERTQGLTLCLDYARQLMTAFQDKTQASDALVYSMFQEMAQVFQSQWGLETSSPEASLDELTTVLMLTFRLDANVRAYSQTVMNQPSLAASLKNAFNDPLHPLSVERAERVLKWATDPDLVRRWQPQLVPHMQTRMLEHLKQHPQPWSDLTLIEQELIARESDSGKDRILPRGKGKIKA